MADKPQQKNRESSTMPSLIHTSPPVVATFVGVYIESEGDPKAKSLRPTLAHLTFGYRNPEYKGIQEVSHVAMPFTLFINTLDFLAHYLIALDPKWRPDPKRVEKVEEQLDPAFLASTKAFLAELRRRGSNGDDE